MIVTPTLMPMSPAEGDLFFQGPAMTTLELTDKLDERKQGQAYVPYFAVVSFVVSCIFGFLSLPSA